MNKVFGILGVELKWQSHKEIKEMFGKALRFNKSPLFK
jgi:hypothetical protein